MAKDNKKITPRSENYSEWYLDVIDQAELAENSVTRGSMVIKPYGYAIWENIQKVLDAAIKATGHKNAYFPLFIPKSLLGKEASHIAGFAKEAAVVTHHRLKSSDEGLIVDPESQLTEEFIVRPTSETIIYDTFAKWIQSWRDLPLLINQWANVVRWEMRTRPFLRTTEFLWQEGHTAHASQEEAEEEARKMLDVYRSFVENYLAISPAVGKKTDSEKFAGALHTYTVEAMMQDGKALQAATSHNLGQNFAKAFDVKFADKNGAESFVWQTSWGISTRIIGALIMSHSDDLGLVLPPMIAPIKAVIVPIYKNDEEKVKVLAAAQTLLDSFADLELSAELDARDFLTPGAKFNEWEKKGVPFRIEIGPKDLESGSAVLVRRDTKEKTSINIDEVATKLPEMLEQMQADLYNHSREFREANTREIDNYEVFKKHFEKAEIPGFVISPWCGDLECEAEIAAELQVSTRCIPFDAPQTPGKCIKCGKNSEIRVVFAKAY